MSEEINYENKYLQEPITFLTEKNLEKLEKHCKKASNYERGIEHKVTLELLYRYDELKNERDKLIEKLEKDLKNIKNESLPEFKTVTDLIRYKGYAEGRIESYNEILQILKGENDES